MAGQTSAGWPDLSRPDLRQTTDALQLWSQIVGKIRLVLTPWENHSWHVPLYVSARGLATGLIPVGRRAVTIEFDLVSDTLDIRDTEGATGRVPLRPQSVATFYGAVFEALIGLGVEVAIDPVPSEIPDGVPFPADTVERAYDGDAARAYWRALVQIHRVFQVFRTRFVGKCSPIHVFWGSFDLALTRFSGRPAPRHPGGVPHLPDAVAREAYSQEVSSAGFWPGGGTVEGPSFYSYCYPAPDGFADARVEPAAALFDRGLGEFLLPYGAVRTSADPDAALLDFLQTTYEAAANLAAWPRARLEGPTGRLGKPPVDA